VKWTPERNARLCTLREQGLTWEKIGLDFGCTRMAAEKQHRKLKRKVAEQAIEVPVAGKNDVGEFELRGDRVITLEELIEHFNVNLDEYEVKEWLANKWEVGTKHPETGVILLAPLFMVKAWFRPKNSQARTLTKLSEGLLADIRAEVRQTPQIIRRPKPQGDYLFEWTPFDLHLGKYAWDEETVTNYDVEHGEDLFNASLDFLLDRALKLSDGKLDRILCVFGNDVSHTDRKQNTTTAGTPMDVDTRYIRVFRRICAIHRRAVDILRQVAPVDIVVIPGNHDELTAFHLGHVLEARYDGDARVKINNSARLRKYYDYGVNLFGFAHGHAEKVNELPLLMAREVPELWARCPSREWHIGHKHIAEKKTWREMPAYDATQDLFSDKGVRVRRLMSMSAHDAWHTQNAYTDRRACDAFIFHRTAGFTDHLSFNIDHFTGKAIST
jgi:hypothetical protein